MTSEPATTWLLAVLFVGLFGALGGVARVWVAGLATRRFGAAFPIGTLVVNVSGASALGLFAGAHGVSGSGGLLAAAIAIGFLGSYTTVSSFALQTVALARAGDRRQAALNVAATFGLGLAGAVLGLALGQGFGEGF